MTKIHVQYERDCYSMTYRCTDAQDVNLILGYIGDMPVFVAGRGADERADHFYERAVDKMSNVVFDFESAREADGFERHRGPVPTLILMDMIREFKTYQSLVPDHVVDDPEWLAAGKGYADYIFSKFMGD